MRKKLGNLTNRVKRIKMKFFIVFVSIAIALSTAGPTVHRTIQTLTHLKNDIDHLLPNISGEVNSVLSYEKDDIAYGEMPLVNHLRNTINDLSATKQNLPDGLKVSAEQVLSSLKELDGALQSSDLISVNPIIESVARHTKELDAKMKQEN